MLVWSEMAAAYCYTDYAVEEFTKEWMEIVRQNYNHPCIITWTPMNESWGVSQIETRKVALYRSGILSDQESGHYASGYCK